MTPMFRKTQLTINLIFKIIKNKRRFFAWISLRFFSALLPLFSIYLFSKVIQNLENKVLLSTTLILILLVIVVRLVDNFTRIKSVVRLDECINDIGFDIHNFFIKDLKSDNKEDRHQSIQAIRNFSNASAVTLTLFRQPGIDSIVSIITIPTILFFVDFKVFIFEIAYITIYMIVDHYTTQKYVKFRDIQNTKIETYYAKLQESNDVDLEQKTFSRHFTRLSNWNFTEWFLLQNSAAIFYTIILTYCIVTVLTGQKFISDIVLIMGYVASTQAFLNSFSSIKDSLTDMVVAIDHLAKNKDISAIDLDDLI
jgi:ABC-type multidrug transport system fused ATPase/permease subunit